MQRNAVQRNGNKLPPTKQLRGTKQQKKIKGNSKGEIEKEQMEKNYLLTRRQLGGTKHATEKKLKPKKAKEWLMK